MAAARTIFLFSALALFAAPRDPRVAEAAQSGDAAALRVLIEQKADVNAALADGTTPLHLAVRADDAAIVDLLLAAGANPNAANRQGVTPLELACINGSVSMIGRLAAAKVNVNATGSAGNTPLMMAARTGIPQAVTALLDHGATMNAAHAVSGQTALMFAIAEGHKDVVDLMIRRGADVNAKTAIDTPPVTAGNLQGIGRAQNREKPVPQGAMTPLLYAARDGRLVIARALVVAGADVNQAEANNESPLLVSIINGHVEVAQFLLTKGAQVNALDGFGRGPLWSAIDLRNLDKPDGGPSNGVSREPVLPLIQALLERGAEVNVRTKVEPPSRRWMMPFGARQWTNPAGQTPFVRAALAGDIAVMKLLLARGADPNIPTFAGVTALMAASGVGWVPRQTVTEDPASLFEAVRLCVERGADVNAAEAKGFTALHGAAYRGSDDVIRFLIEKGAKADAKDKEGRTPAALAEGNVYLAGTPPERRPSTIALFKELVK